MSKKMLCIVIPIAIVVLAGVGCLFYYLGQNNSQPTEINISQTDKEFIQTLEKNLKSRDALVTKQEKQAQTDPASYDQPKAYRDLIDAEASILNFEDANFDNPRLGKLAKDYMNGVKLQQEALEYILSDQTKYNEKWSKGYTERSKAIVDLQKEFNIKVPESSIETFKSVAKSANEEEAEKAAIKTLFDSIAFTPSKTEYNRTTYTAVVENTTSYNFDYVNLKINLMKDDVIVESAYANINKWNTGQKAQFEFNTAKEFDKYVVDGDYYINKD